MKKIVCACVLLLLVSAQSYARDLPLGGLTFTASDGKEHQLKEYIGKGRWVFLNAWGIRCPICVEEMPDLEKLHTVQTKKALVLGFVVDFPTLGYPSLETTNAFMKKHQLTFTNLLGDARLYRQFGAGELRGTPTMLVFTPEGHLLAKQVGKLTYQSLVDFIVAQDKVRSR
ncbi:MAG: TlpA family protein disulfide reductase [Methylococcales bacterium]|jgi:peroxiredoxin|nr:TlpA family protein disulfide reductase [Methylococcales bacterium]MBT7444759.1 TlpA family protein disulfide reductase [Methylococcales bacterium]